MTIYPFSSNFPYGNHMAKNRIPLQRGRKGNRLEQAGHEQHGRMNPETNGASLFTPRTNEDSFVSFNGSAGRIPGAKSNGMPNLFNQIRGLFGMNAQGPKAQGNNQGDMQRLDPDSYAQEYANQKGISLEEAKAELKAEFGDPTEGTQIPNAGPSQDQSLFGLVNSVNNKDDMKRLDPDSYAQEYANQKGISLEEAKAELKAEFGDPTEGTQIPNAGPVQGQSNNPFSISNNKPEKPEQQDPETYVVQYALEKGITVEEAREELKSLYGEPEKK